MEGRCLDVIEIDGASNNSVDQVRDLRDECQYAPAQCRFKIYVIDEVHMLSQAAFNALLNTLEEPPSHVKFVFATTEANKVLPTIVSRCQRFEFRSIPVDLIVSKLQEICDKEEITVEPKALQAIARMAQGGMRDAQSILDQLISFCGTQISQSNVLDVYGLVSRLRIEKLGDHILHGKYDLILEEADAFAHEGVDFYRALLDLADYIREFLVESMKADKGSYPEQAVRVLDALKAGEALVRSGLSEKTNFEVTLLRAVEAGKSRSIDRVIREISGLVSEDIKKKSTQARVKSVQSPNKPSVPKDEASEESVSRSVYDTPSEHVKPEGLVVEEPDKKSQVLPEKVEMQEVEKVEPKNENNLTSEAAKAEEPESKRRVKDQKLIDERTAALPDGVRRVLKDKFRADFVSIEKIDPNLLI